MFQTSMTDFIWWNIKENIKKIVGNQTATVPIDFHCLDS